jgi:hypothetical protein
MPALARLRQVASARLVVQRRAEAEGEEWSRAATSYLSVHQGQGWPGHKRERAQDRALRFCPAMTMERHRR